VGSTAPPGKSRRHREVRVEIAPNHQDLDAEPTVGPVRAPSSPWLRCAAPPGPVRSTWSPSELAHARRLPASTSPARVERVGRGRSLLGLVYARWEISGRSSPHRPRPRPTRTPLHGRRDPPAALHARRADKDKSKQQSRPVTGQKPKSAGGASKSQRSSNGSGKAPTIPARLRRPRPQEGLGSAQEGGNRPSGRPHRVTDAPRPHCSPGVRSALVLIIVVVLVVIKATGATPRCRMPDGVHPAPASVVQDVTNIPPASTTRWHQLPGHVGDATDPDQGPDAAHLRRQAGRLLSRW